MSEKAKIRMYEVIEPNKDLEFDKKLKEKDAEYKYYLICIAAKPGYGDDMWTIVQGRSEAYQYIVDNIECINLDESFILVEGLGLENRKSIYAFCKYVEQYFTDSFDIDDYIKGDWDESEYQKRNDIDPTFNSINGRRVSMEDIMNGNTKFN